MVVVEVVVVDDDDDDDVVVVMVVVVAATAWMLLLVCLFGVVVYTLSKVRCIASTRVDIRLVWYKYGGTYF